MTSSLIPGSIVVVRDEEWLVTQAHQMARGELFWVRCTRWSTGVRSDRALARLARNQVYVARGTVGANAAADEHADEPARTDGGGLVGQRATLNELRTWRRGFATAAKTATFTTPATPRKRTKTRNHTGNAPTHASREADMRTGYAAFISARPCLSSRERNPKPPQLCAARRLSRLQMRTSV